MQYLDAVSKMTECSLFVSKSIPLIIAYSVPGFPRCHSSKRITCQCGRYQRHRFDPWVGKIPLEQETAACSNVPACLANSMDGEPGGLQSLGVSQSQT